MAAGHQGTNAPPARTLIVDNGAYTIKAGFATDTDGPVVIPNCIARDRQRRTYIGAELAQCRDYGEIAYRRPVDRGYIVNWDAQRAIWDSAWRQPGGGDNEKSGSGGDDAVRARLAHDPAETRLLLTEQPGNLPALQSNCDQMVFEEFQFASYYRGPPAQFAFLDAPGKAGAPPRKEGAPEPELRIVVDIGYSFATVTPVLRGRPVHRAVRRLDVGGKLLTNYLTKLLSVRHYDMRNDAHVVNEMKEKACFVSTDFAADLDATWRGPRESLLAPSAPKKRRLDLYRTGSGGLAKEYVLPDFYDPRNPERAHGVVRDYDAVAERQRRQPGAVAAAGAAAAPAEDVIVLRNERFSVPELLFHPADIGLHQPGLAHVVYQAVDALPAGLWPAAFANIVVVGGSARLPGLVQRLKAELRALVPDELGVRVTSPSNPEAATWRGATRYATLPAYAALLDRASVTKQEYDEYGAHWVARKFALGPGDID